nr:uncharacterized protein LOC123753917 [Procambarus clarkii]
MCSYTYIDILVSKKGRRKAPLAEGLPGAAVACFPGDWWAAWSPWLPATVPTRQYYLTCAPVFLTPRLTSRRLYQTVHPHLEPVTRTVSVHHVNRWSHTPVGLTIGIGQGKKQEQFGSAQPLPALPHAAASSRAW